jgi:ABC-type uncharacterized transport system substrate-binding protein
MMRRLLPLALAAAVTGLIASGWAQQPKSVPVVGMLITHASANDPIFENFRVGLREYGYEEGRNIRLEIVTAAGQLDRLPGLAQELIRQNVDVIIAPNEASTRTARQATSTIPIVMVGFANDPVALGFVDSFARPGGNITGLCSLPGELDTKRLELLKETLPGVARVAVFWEDPFGRNSLAEVQRGAQSMDVRLEMIQLRGKQDLEMAFKVAKRRKVGAVLLVWSPTFYVYRDRVALLALRTRLPVVGSFATENGALMSYGSDPYEPWRRAAYYVDRLLKGAKPSDLPVEQISKFKLMVNLTTAKALGITIPESILLRADEVIR